jgi:hypothetical protein
MRGISGITMREHIKGMLIHPEILLIAFIERMNFPFSKFCGILTFRIPIPPNAPNPGLVPG